MLAILLTAGASWAEPPFVGRRADALDSALWAKSQWISVHDAPIITKKIADNDERAADGACWFVTNIKNHKELSSIKWMTSGLGVYNLYINGKPVGEEILKPGFTHYDKTKLSFTYDLTDAVSKNKDAENSFAAQLTPGWWADKIITPWGSEGMNGKKVAFRSVIELTYTDGSKEHFGTNINDWKAGIAGPVKHAAIYDGEIYDARETPGFSNQSMLSTPVINDEFKGGIYPSAGAEIYRRADLALSPVEAYIWQGVTAQTDNAHGKVIIKRHYNNNSPLKNQHIG